MAYVSRIPEPMEAGDPVVPVEMCLFVFFLKSNVIQQYPTCIYGKILIYIYMYEMYTCSKYNIQNINIPMI